MKILVVQDRLRSGGTERQSILLTRAFRAAGHDTTLLTFRPGGELADSAADLSPVVLQKFDTRLDWFAPRLFPTVEKLQPDLILTMGRMANVHASSLQNLVQDRWPDIAVIGTMRTGKKLPWLYRYSLRRVRHVIANSHRAEATLTSQYQIPREKISVIHNAIVFSPDSWQPSAPAEESSSHSDVGTRDTLRARLGASPETVVLLCVAMFRAEKNQRELIEIAAQLPRDLDWQLWLAGDGPARSSCEALVARNNLGERVKFSGFQNDPRPLYRAADIAVLTSLNESLPNFLVEAHAHGLPSVAYQVGGVAECGGHVVDPGNQPHFLASLTTLLTDESARTTSAANVLAHAQTHFSPERQTAAYLTLFARLLKHGKKIR